MEITKYLKVCVILGNGHGSNTKGKRSPDGRLLEYKYTREIVKLIAAELKKLGIPYFILVPEEWDVALTTRVQRVNNIVKQNKAKGITTFYISVHVNAAGNGTWQDNKNADYWTAWTSKGQTAGDHLATEIYKAAHEVLKPCGIRVMEQTWEDGDPDYEADFYVLKKTNCAATLTENLFQDNRKNVDWLLSDLGKQKIAELHVKGIQNYIKNVLKIK